MKFGKLMALTLLLATPWMSGCGGGGTTVGNPVISIESNAYGNGASVLERIQNWLGIATAFAAPVSEFKFCVTKLKLTNSEGAPVTQDGASSIEAILGLIDVSTTSISKKWGEVSIPVGFALKRLDVELHVDPQNCSGATHSIAYNGSQLTRDLEFHFEFTPAVTIQSGDTLKLGLTPIATALEQAMSAGKFNNEQISEYLTSTLYGTGSK